MAAYDFEFIFDTGYIFYVCADSRKEAISLFLEEQGMDRKFLNKHCTVKNLGRVQS